MTTKGPGAVGLPLAFVLAQIWQAGSFIVVETRG